MRRNADLAVTLVVVVAALYYVWLFHDLRHDDAYITFRYGQQLASGNGWVFNEGERLMGSTAPGHALLSAVLYPLAGPWWLPSVMSSLGVLGWVMQSVASVRMLRVALGRQSLIVGGAVLIGCAWSCRFVALETNIAAALALWSIAFGHERRWVWAAALAALGGLMRPDAHLASLVVGIAAIRDLRWNIWKPALVFLAISLPWAIFAWSYFGTIIPQSAHAKTHSTSFVHYFEHLILHPASLPPKARHSWWSALFLWPLAIHGALALLRRDRKMATLIAYGVLNLVAYAWLRPIVAHRWHLYPLVVVFLSLVLVGLVDLANRVHVLAARVLVYCVVGVIFLGGAYRTYYAAGHRGQRMNGSREQTYLKTARYLRKHADANDIVGSLEVGTIAYYTDLRMHDFGRLITRKPIRYRRTRDVPYRWLIVDFNYPRSRPKWLRANKVLRSGRFGVWIYDLDNPRPRNGKTRNGKNGRAAKTR